MAKNIRWQIPFVSLQGIHYRVDIYDEGDFTPVQLTAGPTPFVTNEDASDDFFHPVRSQSGTLQVCTLLPGTTDQYITLDDLLPANNIARAVRLLNLDTSPATIEWQGFLSCEAYSQDYTGIPQILDLPLISVLEAMDSVNIVQSQLVVIPIAQCVKNILNEVQSQSGIELYTNVYYSRTDNKIWEKLINTSLFFKEEANKNENHTDYVVSGVSAKEVIQKLCTFMGWIARENGTSIYFQRIGENIGMYKSTIQAMPIPIENADLVVADINEVFADKWRGTDHKRTISSGAKKIEVTAEVKSEKLNLKLNEFPFGDSSNFEHKSIRYEGLSTKYIYMQVNYNNLAYNNDNYPGYYKYEVTNWTQPGERRAYYIGEVTQQEFIERLKLFSNETGIFGNPLIAGAILVRYAIKDEEIDPDNFESGLYCPLICTGVDDKPIYKMRTFKYYAFKNGKISIKADMLFLGYVQPDALWAFVLSDKINGTIACQNEEMTMVLRVGSWYWNGVSWVRSRASFQVPLADSGIDIEIPTSYQEGDIELEILCGVTSMHHNMLLDVIFKTLTVEYNEELDVLASKDGSNNYIRLLSTNFRDEISIKSELASNNFNQANDSIILESFQKMLELMQYYIQDGTLELRRPEVDLLSRAAEYYQAARQRLSLIVEHISTPLPLLRLNGISPDTRKYLPLAEERDWKTDVCTLTCFEMPTDTQESQS